MKPCHSDQVRFRRVAIVAAAVIAARLVCGGNGALGEVARGGGCLIIDQTSEDAIAVGIKTLLIDPEIYARLCTEARAREFRSWPDYTQNLLEHLRLSACKTAIAVTSKS